MNTITLELSLEDLKRLADGTNQFGSCALVTHTTDGVPVYVTTANHQRNKGGRQRRPKPAQAPPGAEAPERP